MTVVPVCFRQVQVSRARQEDSDCLPHTVDKFAVWFWRPSRDELSRWNLFARIYCGQLITIFSDEGPSNLATLLTELQDLCGFRNTSCQCDHVVALKPHRDDEPSLRAARHQYEKKTAATSGRISIIRPLYDAD